MKFTFKLKKPKGEDETLILFSCYFKNEQKKFVFSTGEKIKPSQWDFIAKQPLFSGKQKSVYAATIRKQMNRYSDFFLQVESEHKRLDEPFGSEALRIAFEREFLKGGKSKGLFYDSADRFVQEKLKDRHWKVNGDRPFRSVINKIKKYEKDKGKEVSFSSINKTFIQDFFAYCNVADNSIVQYQVLLKSFLRWAAKNRLFHGFDLLEFQDVEKSIGKHEVLSLMDLNKLISHKFEDPELEKSIDRFVFACVTGIRFNEIWLVNQYNTQNGWLILKEQKSITKDPREIPLIDLAVYLLKKYNYAFPRITLKMQIKNLRMALKELGYDQVVEKTTVRNRIAIRETIPLYEKIATHTARRTFITLLKRMNVPDKIIAKATGQTVATINRYFQVNNDDVENAVTSVFKMNVPLKKVQ